MNTRRLLSVDLGLRVGLAMFTQDSPQKMSFEGASWSPLEAASSDRKEAEVPPPQLAWFRSHHFRNMSQWKRGVYDILSSTPALDAIWLEGDRKLGDTWVRLAHKRRIAVRRVPTEVWREGIFLPREQRSGAEAKRHACDLAMQVISTYGQDRPSSLKDDAAESILLGLWALAVEGWSPLPDWISRGRPDVLPPLVDFSEEG